MLSVITLTCRILTQYHPTSDLKILDISNRVLAVTAKKCLTICRFVKIFIIVSFLLF